MGAHSIGPGIVISMIAGLKKNNPSYQDRNQR